MIKNIYEIDYLIHHISSYIIIQCLMPRICFRRSLFVTYIFAPFDCNVIASLILSINVNVNVARDSKPLRDVASIGIEILSLLFFCFFNIHKKMKNVISYRSSSQSNKHNSQWLCVSLKPALLLFCHIYYQIFAQFVLT